MENFLDLVKQRRSIYQLNKNLPISEEEVLETIKEISVQLPSAFNSQSARIVILLGDENQKLWDITKETLKGIVGADKFAPTEEKMNSFAAGYGTILYFDDTAITNHFAEQFAAFKDNFPIWANQANGILQFGIWSSLAEKGIGASLQHYNPIIDDEVKKEFNIPDSYQLVAQMPFGGIVEPAGPKDVIDSNKMVVIRK